MARLYKYHNYSSHWVAYTETEGWMLFPMGAGGWEQRRASQGPRSTAFTTGTAVDGVQHRHPGCPDHGGGPAVVSRGGVSGRPPAGCAA
jgi:hypothetical protein